MARLRKPDALSVGDRHRRYVRAKDLLSLKLPRSLLVQLDGIAKGRGCARAEALGAVLTAWEEREAGAVVLAIPVAAVAVPTKPRRKRNPSTSSPASETPAGDRQAEAKGTGEATTKSRAVGRPTKDSSALAVAAGQPGRTPVRSTPDATAPRQKPFASAGRMDDLFGGEESRDPRRIRKRTKR